MSKKKSDKNLLKELIDKGYGEDERKKRLELYKKRIQGKQGNRQNKNPSANKELLKAAIEESSGEPLQQSFATGKSAGRIKNLDPKLRRRIDTYAFKNGCAVTGGKERIVSFLTIINPFLKDFVSQEFFKLLLLGKGYKDDTPYQYCLFDSMEALYYGVRYLLGHDRTVHTLEERKICEEKSEELEKRFKTKLPLVLTFLKRFMDKDKIFHTALLNLHQKYRKNPNLKLETFLLDDLVKGFYRLYLTTGLVEEHYLERILVLVKELCKAQEADPVILKQIDSSLFRFEVAYNNLKEYQHHFFPLLLKQMGLFFTENELRDKGRLADLYTFLGINEEEVITFHNYLENLGANNRLIEQNAAAEGTPASDGEPKNLEAVEAETPEADSTPEDGQAAGQDLSFNRQFGKLLRILKIIFPGSGIEELTQWNYILPYFELNIFSRDPEMLPLLMNIGRYDFVGQIMVVHRILDNMLTSVKINVLDAALHEKNEFKQGMYNLLSKWTEAYTELFFPYLKALNEYKTIKDLRGRITLSNKIKLEKYTEQLRNLNKAMLKTGNTEQAPVKESGVLNIRLYELAEELDQLMSRLSRVLRKELIQKNDPQAIALLKELAKQGAADFQTHNYKPTIKRIKDVLENQYKTANLNASPKAQFTFFEVLILLAHMYNFLLNDPTSFYRRAAEGILLAGADEERLWNRTHKALNDKLA